MRAERDRRGLSQIALGAAVGHSGSWVYGVEQGKHSPSPDDLRLLADTLGLSLQRLISGDSDDSEFIDSLRSLERSLDERGRRTVLALALQQTDEARSRRRSSR